MASLSKAWRRSNGREWRLQLRLTGISTVGVTSREYPWKLLEGGKTAIGLELNNLLVTLDEILQLGSGMAIIKLSQIYR